MKSIRWARGAYLLGLVLAVVLFLPQSWFPLMAGKVAAVALCLLVSGVLYAWALWRGHAEPVPGAALWLLLLPLSYVLSFAFSANRAVGVVGTGIDTDTLFFIALLSAAGLLGAALFRSARDAHVFMRTLFWALIAGALFQLVVLFGVLPGPFADRSVNLIGKWNDFGVMMALLGFLLLVELRTGRLTNRARLGAWAALALVLTLLGLVNFPLAWGLVLAASLALVALGWAQRHMRWLPMLVAVIAGAFLLFGAPLNAQLTRVVPVSSLEVRPSLQSTLDVVAASHGPSVKNAILGTGPNTFGASWLTHKPAAVNQSLFWNLDFAVGFSTLVTAFGSVGLVGTLAWLLPLLLVLAGLWRTRGSEGRPLAWALAATVAAGWATLALYVPSQGVLLVIFAVAGVALGTLWRGRLRRPIALGVGVLLVLVLVFTGFAGARRFVSEVYLAKAADALKAGDISGAQNLGARSVAVELTPENLRFAVGVGSAKLRELAGGSSATQQEFTEVLQQTINAGQRAILLDGQDYRSYVSLGEVYALLAANKVQGAYANATAAYQAAAALNPLNPTIPFMQAQLEASAGGTEGLQAALKRALTLKPDYADAILLLAQVDIARNDLASAISNTKLATQAAPGVPSVWLQLGLLYYAGGDTKNAIAPLEQALKLQSDYANAQYFLGLSYAAQGRTPEALAVFGRLAQTNPDNAQVKSVLANLQAGRAPLEAATSTAAKK